jgi:aminobenzoyl-glutamate transport protein
MKDEEKRRLEKGSEGRKLSGEFPPAPADEQRPPHTPAGSDGFGGFLGLIERVGNRLPHPVTLFALCALGVVLLSAAAAYFQWQVDDPRPERARLPEGVIAARSLMTGEGLRWMVENLVTNFTGFVPLGTVLVSLLGVGVAERSGLLSAAVRALVLGAPRNLITVMIVFAGVLSNTASEMGYVVLIPLAAALFHSLGRHPFAGLAAAFAGVSGGYSANLLLGTVDPLLSGITQEAARMIDPEYEVHPAVNWYFMIASTFLVTGLGTFVTARIVEPKLGAYDPSRGEEGVKGISMDPVSRIEKRGLFWAAVAAGGMALLFLWLAGPGIPLLDGLPGWGILREPETGGLLRSPFLRGVVVMIFVFFLVPGFVYGRITGTMKNDRDVINAMAATMSSMGLYIVLVFFAAQFVSFFAWTNLGSILAVVGADIIKAIRLDNALVFIPFILLCCFVNLMLGSASAQWAITAPIFVPMLMLSGYSPEVIQAAYRIGDSSTNIITPMMSYFGIIFAFAARYDRRLGIGTLISMMLPYTIFFLIGWIALFYFWVFLLKLPVGPASPTYFSWGI